MTKIVFKGKLTKIGQTTLLRLPKDASIKLPSRGMVMVEGTVNGHRFQAPLEPDGRGSHWFKVDKNMGDFVKVEMSPVSKWSEPKMPADFGSALADNPRARTAWKDITPMARWDFLRWIGSTKQPETRKRRIEVACAKLEAGKRRPCCFNRTQCCDPLVSDKGVLMA